MGKLRRTSTTIAVVAMALGWIQPAKCIFRIQRPDVFLGQQLLEMGCLVRARKWHG